MMDYTQNPYNSIPVKQMDSEMTRTLEPKLAQIDNYNIPTKALAISKPVTRH